MITEEDVLSVLAATSARSQGRVILKDVPLVDQGMDSLDMAVLLYELERKFSLNIPTNTLGRLRTIDDVMHFLNCRALGTEGID